MQNSSTDAADLGATPSEVANHGPTENAEGASPVGAAIARRIEQHAVPLLVGAAVGAVAALALVSAGPKRGGVRALFTRSEPTLLAIVIQAAVVALGRTVSRQVVAAAVEKSVTRVMAGPVRQQHSAPQSNAEV